MMRWKRSLRILNQNKILPLLGLATRGRNLVSGEFQTLEAVRDGSCLLVLVAEDASDNTKKRFFDKGAFYEVPVACFGTKESLGRAIGKEYRSVLGVCEPGFAGKILEQLEIK